jgi:hypothetical protein
VNKPLPQLTSSRTPPTVGFKKSWAIFTYPHQQCKDVKQKFEALEETIQLGALKQAEEEQCGKEEHLFIRTWKSKYAEVLTPSSLIHK